MDEIVPIIYLPEYFQDIVLFCVRILLTMTFFYEARVKFKDIKSFSESHNMPVPVSYIVASAEFLAAVSMLTGFMAQYAALGIMLLMIVTTYMQIFTWKNSYWASKGGWEYDVIMFVFAAVILVYGPGVIMI